MRKCNKQRLTTIKCRRQLFQSQSGFHAIFVVVLSILFLMENLTVNQRVAGSSPAGGAENEALTR
jgi:hypothetical protein